MKRFVWGCILCSLCGLSMIGLLSEGQAGVDIAPAFLFDVVGIAAGGLLIYYGRVYLRRCKAIVEVAATLYSEAGCVKAAEVMDRTGESPLTVYQALARAQRNRQLPHNIKVS